MPLTRLTAEQRVWSYTVAKCLTYKQLPVLHKGKFKSTQIRELSCIIAHLKILYYRQFHVTTSTWP